MKKNIFILAMIGLFTLNVHAQKKAPKQGTKPGIGNSISDLKKELIKKYKYQSINIYILSTKLNIDIADIHVRYLPKNIRQVRSKEIAEFSRSFLNSTPDGVKILKGISMIGINHLKNPAGGVFQPIGNIYDNYSY